MGKTCGPNTGNMLDADLHFCFPPILTIHRTSILLPAVRLLCLPPHTLRCILALVLLSAISGPSSLHAQGVWTSRRLRSSVRLCTCMGKQSLTSGPTLRIIGAGLLQLVSWTMAGGRTESFLFLSTIYMMLCASHGASCSCQLLSPTNKFVSLLRYTHIASAVVWQVDF
jgi:hypothetical protein